jgi:uncharacterized membrane protein (DUF485 family)
MDTNEMNNPMVVQAAAGQQMFNQLVEKRKKTQTVTVLLTVIALVVAAVLYIAVVNSPQESAPVQDTDYPQ